MALAQKHRIQQQGHTNSQNNDNGPEHQAATQEEGGQEQGHQEEQPKKEQHPVFINKFGERHMIMIVIGHNV